MSPCLLMIFLLLSPVGAGSDQPSAKKLDVQAVLEADAAFGQAALEHDRDAFRDALLGDALFLGERAHRGRVAFLGAWSPLFDPAKGMRFEWEPLQAEIADSGEIAYSVGRVKVSFPRPGTDEIIERPGHYLTGWKKETPSGKWKIWANGTLVIHPDPTLGIARERRRALAEVWSWPPLASLEADVRLEWHPERLVEAGSGELAVSLGQYEVEARLPVSASPTDGASPTGDREAAGSGAYLSVWKKDAAGFWTLAAESFSPPIQTP